MLIPNNYLAMKNIILETLGSGLWNKWSYQIILNGLSTLVSNLLLILIIIN